jgi:signal transduction histidine kinase
MADEKKRFTSDFFKVFSMDAREASRGLVSGDVEKDELRIAMLLATINAANSLVGASEVVNRVVDMTIMLTSADRGILLLKEPDGKLSVQVARNCFGKPLQLNDPFSHSIPAQVIETGKSYWIVDTLSEDKTAIAKSVQDLQLRTIMCAPLKIRGEITGVIYLDSKLTNKEFRNADLAVFEALCLQLAVTLENAWLNHAAVQTERNIAVGTLTQILMEHLITPLVEVESHAMALEEDDAISAERRAQAGQIRKLVSQSLELLDTIHETSGDDHGFSREECTLASLVQSALERYRTKIEAYHIDVSFNLDSEGQLAMDPERMGRVVSSLVRNAIDAMPQGGALSINLADQAEGWVELSIVDSGSDAQKRSSEAAFEPFMSKGGKGGSGNGDSDLDLAIVRQIVENHGGSISADNPEPGRTRFVIRLRAEKE